MSKVLIIVAFVFLYLIVGLSFGSFITWSNLFVEPFSEWTIAGRFVMAVYTMFCGIVTFERLDK